MITPSVMQTPGTCCVSGPRPLTVTEWSRGTERWVVSARQGEEWTLVGVFEHAEQAFRAADRAAERLAPSAER